MQERITARELYFRGIPSQVNFKALRILKSQEGLQTADPQVRIL